MFRALKDGCETAQIIHANGNWMMPHAYMDWARKGTDCKLVFSPRGSFSPTAQARSRIKKAIINAIGVRKAIEHVDMFHATSDKEYGEIRALGYRQPVVVLPIGIKVPDAQHGAFEADRRKLIFLGRLHETKAVDHLLRAWAVLAKDFPAWSIDIAGPDCGMEARLREMVVELNLPRVRFVGKKQGDEKDRFYASADLYVLPSLTENFGITVAEALASGTPVVVSRGCPWGGVVKNGCGWWYETGVKGLETVLRDALSRMPDELEKKGMNGRQWILRDYQEDAIGKKLLQAYEWLLNGGDKPECVRVIEDFPPKQEVEVLRWRL